MAVSGAGGTTGGYTVRLILNAAAENESHDGATNNTRGTAQNLDNAAVQLNSANPKATRLAAVGSVAGGAQPGQVYVGNRSFNFFGGSVLRYDDEGHLVQTITSPVLDNGVISDVELGPNNVIYVALSTNFFGSVVEGEIAKFDLAGNYLGSVPLPDDSNFGYLYPYGFDVAPDGSLWVPQLNSGNLVHVDAAGNLLGSYFISFNLPQDAAVRSDGQVFVSQGFSPDVLQLDPGTGTVTPFAFDPNFNAVMLNFQPGGDLWLGDFNGPTRFDSTGTLTQFIPNFGTIDPQVDPSQNLWVSNFANGYIQRFDPAGNFQFASPTPDGSPLGIAVLGVDSASPLPPVDLVDYYSFTLEKNSTATIAVELLSGSPVTVELLSPSGQTISLGTMSGSIDQVIDDFVATAAGKYYVKISGDESDYSLVVTKNATFDIGDNDSIATAQQIISPEAGGSRTVLGYVGSTSVVINAVDSGWYDQSGFHDPFNENYFVGGADGTYELRDFFVFDSSALAGNSLLSAQFRAYNPNGEDGFLGFGSSDPTETYTMHGVSTPTDQLIAGGSGLTGIFDDLGSGIAYGSTVVSAADNGQLVRVDLSPAAVADLASKLGGPLALGGAITTLAGNSSDQFLFSGTFNFRDYPRELALQLPESDFYQVLGDSKKTIEVETITPADNKGEFVNTLNPYLKLYDAHGNLLASNFDGASDHRNAKLKYKPDKGETGPYFIQVGAEGDTKGEYILSVKNTSPVEEPFKVDSTVPPSGSLLYGPPADIAVNFNDQFNATTLQGAI